MLLLLYGVTDGPETDVEVELPAVEALTLIGVVVLTPLQAEMTIRPVWLAVNRFVNVHVEPSLPSATLYKSMQDESVLLLMELPI